ncbi:MAG TPA: GntR family transcriptional regulator [Jiangellaceae bacterium]
MSEAPERTALYRLYDATDRLLYIGITKTPATRWQQHAREKSDSWWSDVARKTIEWFNSRPEAEVAEVNAIRTEGPPYNDRHSVNWDEPGCRRAAPIPSEQARQQRSAVIERSARFNRECRKAKISFPEMAARKLRERIASGEYPVGAKLPRGWDLSREIGISTLTLTRAMALLKREGLIESRPGLGTFVIAEPH